MRENSTRKDKKIKTSKLVFYTRAETFRLTTQAGVGEWLNNIFDRFTIQNAEPTLLKDLKQNYEKQFSSSKPKSSKLSARFKVGFKVETGDNFWHDNGIKISTERSVLK